MTRRGKARAGDPDNSEQRAAATNCCLKYTRFDELRQDLDPCTFALSGTFGQLLDLMLELTETQEALAAYHSNLARRYRRELWALQGHIPDPAEAANGAAS